LAATGCSFLQAGHPFNSFFTLLRKRRSVPWAMIFPRLGLDQAGLVETYHRHDVLDAEPEVPEAKS